MQIIRIPVQSIAYLAYSLSFLSTVGRTAWGSLCRLRVSARVSHRLPPIVVRRGLWRSQGRSGDSRQVTRTAMGVEARQFIFEAEIHLMACHRRAITREECIDRLEEVQRRICSFGRALQKSEVIENCQSAALESLRDDAERAAQSVSRMVRWLENAGLAGRILPPCDSGGTHARFAVRATDGGLRWISLLNWSFDGFRLQGFDHLRLEQALLQANEIVDWCDLRPSAQG